MSLFSRTLAWRERPVAELTRLSWPIVISMLSFGVMTLVDTLFVAGLGTSALAGVGLGGTAAFVLLTFPMGLLRGVKVLVSQTRGAGGSSVPYLGAGLALGLGLGFATLLLGLLLARVLPLVAASESAGDQASAYLTVRILGAPFVLTFIALREFRYGEGDTRSSMHASLIGNAANIGLNWLLVIVLEWGVVGSASATVLGHAVELAVVALAQAEEGFPLRATRLSHVAAVFEVGVPTGLQFVLEMGSFALLSTMISSMGENDMAAHQIALQVVHFSFLPTVALGEAGSVMAGEAVGAGHDALVLRVGRWALAISLLYTGAFSIVTLALGRWIIAAFRADAEVAPIALDLLHVAAAFQLADGAAVVARGVLRGAGDIKVPAWFGIGAAWCCTPPLTYLLGWKLGWGAVGGWIGFALEIFVLAALCWWRLERGSWNALAAASRERLTQAAPA